VINMPITLKYKTHFIIIGLIGAILFIVFFTTLIYMIRRTIKHKKETRELESISRSYLNSIGSGSACTWWCSANDLKLHFDERLKDFTGKPRLDFNIEDVLEYVHPDDKDLFSFLKVHILLSVSKNSFEFRANLNGEGMRWFRCFFNSHETKNGNYMFAGIFMDIHEQKANEKQLEESIEWVQKSDLKQSFLANMSHEIRTPLNAVVGFSNLLSDDEFAASITEEEREEYMQLVNSNSELLQNIIDSILEISNIESGGLQFLINSYPIERLTREIYQSYNIVVRKDIEFLYEPCKENVEIDVDKLRFTQVLDNLLSNSNKFTNNGYIKLGSIYKEETNEVEIFVEDTGKGISEKDQTLIFERFYKADESAVGTGLGLPLCKLITEKMNGSIHVESTLGKGSKFYVVFPCRKKEEEL